ncbi:MAG: 50S ribosomal protein L17 [Victivallales bacterium]
MRHRYFTFKIGRSSAHRTAMLGNQVSSLIMFGQIKTTIVKAKQTRRVAEKMITYAKKGDLHHRRLAISKIRDEDAVKKLFSEIAPKYAERKGGYTRIIRVGQRLGDAAEMCILQLVGEENVVKPAKKKKSAATKKTAEKQSPKKGAVTKKTAAAATAKTEKTEEKK